jgi:hypothetical protein
MKRRNWMPNAVRGVVAAALTLSVWLTGHLSQCIAADTVELDAMPGWLPEFGDPPATWRPQIFFVTNGKLNRERTTAMLRQYRDRGIGGVFFHCRPGLITEYLSDEYFAQWDWALTECKRLGMECHIYDENAFPSGFASGEVLAADPTLGAKYLAPVKITRPDQAPDEGVVAFFTGLDADEPKFVDLADVVQNASKQNPVWAVVLTEVSADLRHGGFPYPDLLRRETAEIFLRTTHDKYAERFAGDFGGAIKYVFTDEPRLPGKQGIPFSDALAEAFRSDHGYDLRDKLESLLFERPDSTAVRFDYFSTVRNTLRLMARPMHPLCEIMPVYVLGEFALQSAPVGFTIVKPRPLQLGSWIEQGMPFYPGKVSYRYTFSLDQAADQLAVTLPDWDGTLGQLSIDGRQVGLFAWPPDRLELETELPAGQHLLEIKVAGNPRNQMEPHFSKGLPIVYSWFYGAKTEQPGETYMLWPCGLNEPPVVEVSK